MIDFMKFRPFSALLSCMIFATFIGTYLYKYTTNPYHQTFNYSVDFVGGIQLLAEFNQPVAGEKIVHILDSHGWSGAVTREFSPNEHLIRLKNNTPDVEKETEKIKKTLENNLGTNYHITIKKTDSVGSGMGAALRAKSLYAITLALILMVLYIALRFWSFSYAMGAIVSLFHDALVILTIFLLLDKEISINVIGAILAVLGYSINDTIVIFARIRENIQRMPGTPIKDIVNLSINETLSRTLLTTFATTLVVIALFLFGGEVLRDLSLALLIGIVFGIYSTIYIACPVMVLLYKDQQRTIPTH
jgi:preprotein translocase subunit SecF